MMVQEVRVFVDSTIPADEKTEASPYAIRTALLGLEAGAAAGGRAGKNREETAAEERDFKGSGAEREVE
ncbi:MAG: hypothetical protein ACLUHE_16385 [Christensenellales bacterium]